MNDHIHVIWSIKRILIWPFALGGLKIQTTNNVVKNEVWVLRIFFGWGWGVGALHLSIAISRNGKKKLDWKKVSNRLCKIWYFKDDCSKVYKILKWLWKIWYFNEDYLKYYKIHKQVVENIFQKGLLKVLQKQWFSCFTYNIRYWRNSKNSADRLNPEKHQGDITV